ncbi:hypothetical protein GCM10010094_59370 [Streptomyces flaveus]|jgi:hypothetical protein|uniref:DUF4244 domain-containing protein n=2 Tax=Streptomyces flaveus TaxID=66370 RepID=A0A917VJI4_9ACTN|nr:hypothetical protein GCM10010094_59370 [Streptomyces flaveus]
MNGTGPAGLDEVNESNSSNESTERIYTGVRMSKAMRVRVRAGRVQALMGRAWELPTAWAVRRTSAARRDAGMVTSEYAMGLIAAVGFAALLYEVLTSGQVKGALQDIVERALNGQF